MFPVLLPSKKLHTFRTLFRDFAPISVKNLISNVSTAWLTRHLTPVPLLTATGSTVEDILHSGPHQTDGRYKTNILPPFSSHIYKADLSASCARFFTYQKLFLPLYRGWVLYILLSITEEAYLKTDLLIIFVTIEFSETSIPALGSTQSPIQRVPEALFPGVKWLGREDDHLPQSNTEGKNAWIYASTPTHFFKACIW